MTRQWTAFAASAPIRKLGEGRAACHTPCGIRATMGLDARVSRRQALSGAALALAGAVLAPREGVAAMYNTSVKAPSYPSATDPKTTLPQLMLQINDGYIALCDLQERWDEKTKALDGDVVRRILGTVGVTSPLFNIRKTFLRAWKIIAESGEVDEEVIDSLEESWNGVLDGISAVDYQVYSIGYTELLETKLNLVDKSKGALDKTVDLYQQFLRDIPPSLL